MSAENPPFLACPNVCGPIPKLGMEIVACQRRRWHRGDHEHGGDTWWARGTGTRWAWRVGWKVRRMARG
jgi:hypothetical protein